MGCWEDYLVPFYNIGENYNFKNLSSFYEEGSIRFVIESVSHELAHAVVIGKFLSSSEIADHIKELSDQEADKQELWTLAVEVSALRELGMRVSLSKAADWAHDMMRQGWLAHTRTVYKNVLPLFGTPSIEMWKGSFLAEVARARELTVQ